MCSAETLIMRIGLPLFVAALALLPAAAEAAPNKAPPKKQDYAIVSLPSAKKTRCSPIFFCKTHEPKRASPLRSQGGKRRQVFSRQRQVDWCLKYAATVLGMKVKSARKHLVLIQIGSSVGLSLLKDIATQATKLTKCRGPWPANKASSVRSPKAQATSRLDASKRSMTKVNEVAAASSQEGLGDLRGVVLLEPEEEYTDPEEAALVGPDFAHPSGEFVAAINDLPSDEACADEAIDQDSSTQDSSTR